MRPWLMLSLKLTVGKKHIVYENNRIRPLSLATRKYSEDDFLDFVILNVIELAQQLQEIPKRLEDITFHTDGTY
ncbi:hypothetical protein llap_1902 [Limosa lapponica baueri]|uniref:Uncharacterized protein n=1 Tax=Limosa lapponica baueri TaxID=1758121 RepID=A0A2I0UP29_LIMLA|nr:hypothetical protein llap_1902 [Limosa lapponica baueri]